MSSANVRKGHRLHVNKTVDKIKALIREDDPDCSALNSYKKSLEEKLDTLKTLDAEILATLTEEADIEKEIDESSDLREMMQGAIFGVEERMKKISQKNPPSLRDIKPALMNDTGATSTIDTAKLPKLQLKSFSGKLSEFQCFWDCFQAMVHSSKAYSDVVKFVYLRGALEGSAYSAISGLTLSAANYKEAIDILQDRYGNKQALISVHIGKLTNIKPVTNPQNIPQIREVFDTIEINVRNLNSLGVKTTDYGPVLVSLVGGKFPQKLIEQVARVMPTKEVWDVDELLKNLKAEVESREMCARMTGVDIESSSTVDCGGEGEATTAYSLHTSGQQGISCTYCRQNHTSAQCTIVTDVQARKALLRQKKKCFVCLKSFHTAERCRSNRKCFKCGSKHHISICESNQEISGQQGNRQTQRQGQFVQGNRQNQNQGQFIQGNRQNRQGQSFQGNRQSQNQGQFFPGNRRNQTQGQSSYLSWLQGQNQGQVSQGNLGNQNQGQVLQVLQGNLGNQQQGQFSQGNMGQQAFNPQAQEFTLPSLNQGQQTGQQTGPRALTGNPPGFNYAGVTAGSRDNTLLQTASTVICNNDIQLKLRALFDNCSQYSFINEDACQKLRLTTIRREKMILNGFESKSESVRNLRVVRVSMKGWGDSSIQVEMYVVPQICSPIQGQTIEASQEIYPHLAGLQLADNAKGTSTLHIDLLVGGDFYWDFFSGNTIRGASGPVAVESSLGWILSGSMGAIRSSSVNIVGATHVMLLGSLAARDQVVVRKINEFWDVENSGLGEKNELITENFNKSVKFDGSNYSVCLPWKCAPSVLPDNFSLCRTRLVWLLKKLYKNRKKLETYDGIIKEQGRQGIVEDVIRQDGDKFVVAHYLPHHAVERKDRVTCSTRICNDGTAHLKNQPSINDCLETGPCFLPKLFDMIVRLRCWKYALISDIKAAFLNIRIDEADRDFLRFLWIKDINSECPEICVKRFTSLPFGLRCSPYLLYATVKHHVEKYSNVNPIFVEKFLRDLYVDDNATGVDDEKIGFEYYFFIKTIMLEAGFHLRKWNSNSKNLLEKINENEERVFHEELVDLKKAGDQKILGVKWEPEKDELIFEIMDIVNKAKEITSVTKRSVLKVVASIFDPLGILSPAVILLKNLFQEVCTLKIDWDIGLPSELVMKWNNVLKLLSDLTKIQIPRHYLGGRDLSSCQSIELHGFSDASVKACSAVIYVRSIFENDVICSIVAAKTKVTPINVKSPTVPKLELSGCLLLSRLMKTVLVPINELYQVTNVVCWTDSSDCLHWVNNKERVREKYVQCKVNEIRSNVPIERWRHCPGNLNPADLPSRGLKKVDEMKLWIQGPNFLNYPHDLSFPPVLDSDPGKVDVEEVKNVAVHITTPAIVQSLHNLIDVKRFSTIHKLLRVTCYVLKFASELKKRMAKIRSDSSLVISYEEMKRAKFTWIKADQDWNFSNAKRLKELEYSLAAFRDNDGVLRMKGRLENLSAKYNQKFPILLDKDSYITSLIILDCHEKVGHCRTKSTLNELRAKYWVTQGRRTVSKVIKNCTTCLKAESKPFKGLPVAPLPDFRLRSDFAFSCTGIDYFGPLYVKNIFNSGDDLFAVHTVLYTCASSRAIHLDLVPDPSCIAFVRSLKRFINHYGVSKIYISDNATCFVGPELTSFVQRIESEWKFILPASPWWGGYWERLVQSCKRCLRKVLGKAKLTYEELLTVLAEVEGVLNSRPLCHIYDDNIEEVLTPSHLVFGKRLLNPCYENATPETMKFTSESVSSRAKFLSTLLDHFWQRWVNEYITELREFHNCKNKIPERQVEMGEVVLIHDKLPRGRWRMGLVEELHTGKDGLNRGCKLRTITSSGRVSYLHRPINKLYPMEVKGENEKLNAAKICHPIISKEKVKGKSENADYRQLDRPRRAAAELGILRRRENMFL